MVKMVQHPEGAYWLALAYASGLKLARVKTIVAAWCLEAGRPLAALFELSPAEMAARLGISEEEGSLVRVAASRVSEQVTWLAQTESRGTQLITRADPRYPDALVRGLPPVMQPLLLFCQGDVHILRRPSAAVIGARHTDAQGIGLARELAMLLAEEGLAVLSGLGKGVGQATFSATISTEGGQAIAVLPTGISAFPGIPGAAEDLSALAENGQVLLISPFHPKANFSETQAVARNKLIVGLAEAVFVVAVGVEGVARETADESLRRGKVVCVWDLDPSNGSAGAGNQALIQAGALPITGVPDILDALEVVVARALERMEAAEPPPATSPPSLPQVKEEEVPYDPQAVLDLISKTGRVPEALARRLGAESEDQP
jgi:predicted Rossmann fold nucleotide-binding protein DprA/Smf involved in DNA uptake